MVKNVKVTDILKVVQKLNSKEEQRLREYLIDKLPISSSASTVLKEISERKTKMIIDVLFANQNINR